MSDYERSDSPEPWVSQQCWDVATDLDLSPGVIWLTDRDGLPYAIGILGEDDSA